MYLEYGFPTVAALALLGVFLIDRSGHPKAASASLFVALICILVPEIVNFYKKADDRVEKLANENYNKTFLNAKDISDLRTDYRELKKALDDLNKNENKVE
jgi:site-specific DNA-adenine methylase